MPVILHDVPAEQVALGFDRYAKALSSIITSSRPRFAIGIFGGWGSGKTTLMKAIMRELNSPEVVKVEFSAWRYEREQNLIIPLLDTVRDGLLRWAKTHPDRGQQASAEKVATIVGRVVRALVAGVALKVGVPHALTLELDAGKALDKWKENDPDNSTARSLYHAAFTALTEAFTDFAGQNPARRIIVFVDDLDRCLPNGAVEVIEAMKLFFDLDGFVFVVGLDEKVVEASVEHRYLDFNASRAAAKSDTIIRGADYIKKIFQVPFSLGPVSVNDLDWLIQSALEEAAAPPDQRQDVQGRVVPHLLYVTAGNFINPREIKRYINAYTIQQAINPVLDRDAVLAIQSMRFRPEWHALYRALLLYQQGFIDALRAATGPEASSALDALDDELVDVPIDFRDYVAAGSPGSALLQVFNIAEYISAGEATKAEGNSQLIEVSAKINLVRRRIRGLGSNAEPKDAPTLTELQHALRSASDMISSTSPSSRQQGVARSELERLNSEIEAFTAAAASGGTPQPLKTAELDQKLRKIIRTLISTS